MSIQECSEPECSGSEGDIELLIGSSSKDLGDFSVRRVLQSSSRQRVGPFIFFDHMGPADFAPGQGINVRPHPHIGLSTVTFLFEGVIRHQDSLGFDQEITSGAVNWMTAGHGIVHSERSPKALRASGSKLHGLQVWLALPIEHEETEPSFVHHPASTIPRVRLPGASLALIAGEAYGEKSPVETISETLFLAGSLEQQAEIPLPDAPEERAVYVAEGEVELGDKQLGPGKMAVVCPGRMLSLKATQPANIAIIGGASLPGERFLWWNFVASSRERMEKAKADWKNRRFPEVPGDPEFIPLPKG